MHLVSSLSDEDHLRSFGGLVGLDNQRTAELLTHVGEIDRRKLWARYGHSSMFNFCLDRFHMSEPVAGKRMGVARIPVRWRRGSGRR